MQIAISLTPVTQFCHNRLKSANVFCRNGAVCLPVHLPQFFMMSFITAQSLNSDLVHQFQVNLLQNIVPVPSPPQPQQLIPLVNRLYLEGSVFHHLPHLSHSTHTHIHTDTQTHRHTNRQRL